MKIDFLKMQAAGNDYIYIDESTLTDVILPQQKSVIAQKLSLRRFSVGADGVVFMRFIGGIAYHMDMYNADGSYSPMCGNALRCVAYYAAQKLGKTEIVIETGNKKYNAEVCGNFVTANLKSPHFIDADPEKIYDKDLISAVVGKIFFVNTGNNHAVILSDKFTDNGLIAPLFTNCKSTFDGINAELCHIANGKVYVSVYERGTGETFCCGSGAVAVYFALSSRSYIESRKTELVFKGGSLYAEKIKGDIFLGGSVKSVYRGTVDYAEY